MSKREFLRKFIARYIKPFTIRCPHSKEEFYGHYMVATSDWWDMKRVTEISPGDVHLVGKIENLLEHAESIYYDIVLAKSDREGYQSVLKSWPKLKELAADIMRS